MNHSIASRVSLGVTYRLLLTSGHDAKRPLSRHDAQHGLHLSDGGRWEAALPSQYYFWRCSRCLLGVGFLLRLRLQSEALLHCQALHLRQIPVPRVYIGNLPPEHPVCSLLNAHSGDPDCFVCRFPRILLAHKRHQQLPIELRLLRPERGDAYKSDSVRRQHYHPGALASFHPQTLPTTDFSSRLSVGTAHRLRSVAARPGYG